MSNEEKRKLTAATEELIIDQMDRFIGKKSENGGKNGGEDSDDSEDSEENEDSEDMEKID